MTESGERIIPGSRRPDGTLRKEIRVRPGYVPLEEQAVYVSRGAKFRDTSKMHIPGMDPQALAAAKAANAASLKSKSAKKNEKRKEKRTAAREPGAASATGTDSATAAARSLEQLDLGSGGSKAAAAPPPAAAQDPAAEAAKQARALKKKLRQCEVLKREDDEGKELTPEERRKLGMMAEWQQELDNLESLIS
mmetsp:Transcript_2405/g.7211  ORF Transcript_2405/g.7211 Transcript_2405/m.7211 type:complete len:193 (-) Transcript_2405:125-703(-)|eukprot:CAMPEP_0206144244 /NCGR_PEP_ID=MMETSP1473-20131121/23508_1 /ASSEMBLY_ACC=CAM_ASM_001109 /TAXON_ID=1461547 /ORGANISM="Stichococcus sp, Strain RCC1054" /LENGTH=192 /DNA_ID=CAMNT_0053540007 /DNA_START=174 /DNA_END=752 /DNA_ORIENTATION=+